MGLYWLMKSKETHPASRWVGLEDHFYFRSSIFLSSRSSKESRSGASFFAGTRVFKNAAINPSTGSENLPAISDSSAIATTSQLPAQSGS